MPHMYVQFGGKLPGNEEWSCGFRLVNDTNYNINDGDNLLPTLTTIISDFHARPNSLLSPRAKLSFVKCNPILVNGRYAKDTTNEQIVADIGGGQNASLTPANQIAIVVSLTTGVSRGPAHRGRVYLPLPAIQLADDGRMSEGEAGALRASFQTMLTSIAGIGTGYSVAVMSRKAGAPAHRLVTGCQVGRVLDTQRRRRRSLIEAYA